MNSIDVTDSRSLFKNFLVYCGSYFILVYLLMRLQNIRSYFRSENMKNLLQITASYVTFSCIVFAIFGLDPVLASILTVDPGDSIQEAIDNANKDDTIYVRSGVYKETINITKPVVLLGLGQPMIEADYYDYAVSLSANNIVFDGFKITNSVYNCVSISSNFNTITNNYITDGCICLENSHKNIISQNIIFAPMIFSSGISLNHSSDNIVKNNVVTGGWIGSSVHLAKSSYNLLFNNSVYSGGHLSSAIVLSEASNHNNLTQNEAICGWDGCGVYIRDSNNNSCSLNEIRTTCSGWRPDWLVFWGNGVYLLRSINNTFINNNVSNGYIGISLDSSRSNTFENNDVWNNLNGFGLQNSTNNYIYKNTIRDNLGHGCGLLKFSNGNIIKLNLFKDNSNDIMYQETSNNNHYLLNSMKHDIKVLT